MEIINEKKSTIVSTGTAMKNCGTKLSDLDLRNISSHQKSELFRDLKISSFDEITFENDKLESGANFSLLSLHQKKLLSCSTIFYVLEYLESISQAQQFIRKACFITRNNIYIKQKYFDADPFLYQNGFETFFSPTLGHTNHMTTADFQNIFEQLRFEKAIKNYIIAYRGRITEKEINKIHSDEVHSSNESKIKFDYPIYKEIIACLDINGSGWGKLWSEIGPEFIAVNSKYKNKFNLFKFNFIPDSDKSAVYDLKISLAKKDIAIRAFQEELYKIYSSKSWRYTFCMRLSCKIAQKILNIPFTPNIRGKIKKLYLSLPLFLRRSWLIEICRKYFKSKETKVY